MSRKDKEIGGHQQEQHRAVVHPDDALRLVEAVEGVDILEHDGVSPEDEEDAGLQRYFESVPAVVEDDQVHECIAEHEKQPVPGGGLRKGVDHPKDVGSG